MSEWKKNWPTTYGAHGDERTWNLSRFQRLWRSSKHVSKETTFDRHLMGICFDNIWYGHMIWTSDWGACPSLALHGAREPVKRPLTRFASAWLSWEMLGGCEWMARHMISFGSLASSLNFFWYLSRKWKETEKECSVFEWEVSQS